MDRYNLISEGMSDPPTPSQSPTGEWAYAADALAVEAERDHCLRILHRIADACSGSLDAADCQRIAAQGVEDIRDINR